MGEQQATQKPTEPEPEAESTTPSGPPPPSHCTSDGGYQCLTKAEVEFYFQLDEVLDGGDPCFDTPFTGTKRCIIRKDGWFTNWSWTPVLASQNVDVKEKTSNCHLKNKLEIFVWFF